MGLKARWEEFKWRVSKLGWDFRGTFILGWFYLGALLYAVLFPRLGPVGAVTPAILIGEIGAGLFSAVLARLAARVRFAAYTVERVRLAATFKAFGSRVEDLPRYMISYLKNSVPDGEAFLLSALQGSSVLALDETPKTSADISRVITLDLVDKASREAFPWPAVEPFLQALAAVFVGPKVSSPLRDALRDQYLKAGPGYRKYVVAPHPGELSQFLESHSWFLPVVSAIAIILPNLIIILQFLPTGHL